MLNSNIKRTCSFYVSKIHLVTMLLPYIYKMIQNEKQIKTILECDLDKEITLLMSKMNFNEEIRNKIKSINWFKEDSYNLSIKEEDIFLIVGSNKFIDENVKMLEEDYRKNITIISCYEALEEQKEISNILNKNKYILSTIGERKIEEVFKEEKKQKLYGNMG